MNKSARTMYNELIRETEKLNVEEKSIYERKFNLGSDINELIGAVILEEKLLSKGKWFIELNSYKDQIILECQQRSNELSDLSDLAESNWHCSYSFGVAELRFDDGKISLRINEALAASFIKENKINVDFSVIDEEISKSRKTLESLEQIKKVCEKV